MLRLDFLSKIKVFEAGVHNLVYFFQKADGTSWKPERRVHDPEFGIVQYLPTDEQTKLDRRAFFPEEGHPQTMGAQTVELADVCYISYGLRPSSDENEAKGEFCTADLVSGTKDKVHCKPFVEGKHLACWVPLEHLWLEWGTVRAPSQFCRPTFPQMYTVTEKILAQRSPGPDPLACYDNSCLVFSPSSVGFIPWCNLSGVKNRSIRKRARYRGEKPPRPDLPKREELEKTSRRFSVKYLLAVMNSTFARDFLRANRRSNIHLYPDDWKKLPIPDVPLEQQEPLVRLVDQILAIKGVDISADVSVLEKEVDRLVYLLYGLNPRETELIEGASAKTYNKG
jgi:adenine-specific DNA-methyltransferase